MQRLQHRADFGDVREVFERLLHVHLEDVMDVLVLEAYLQRLAIEAVAFAHRTRHPHVGEEVHLQPIRPVPLARLAAAAGLVEAEAPRLVPADLRLRHLRIEVADQVEDLDVRRRVGARRSADRRLVDVDHLVNQLQPVDAVVRADGVRRGLVVAVFDLRIVFTAKLRERPLHEDVVDER